MGIANISLISATSSWPVAKVTCTMNAKKDPSNDLNTIIDKKVAKNFSHQEKKKRSSSTNSRIYLSCLEAMLGAATTSPRIAISLTKD
eukprot:9221150-Ditylum_brightwellii.AAC.1